MDFKLLTIFLPLLGALYGVFLGMYIRSEQKTPRKRTVLLISGILLFLICATVLVKAFTD